MGKLAKIYVAEKAFSSEDSYDIIYSNNTFIKLLISEGVNVEQLHRDALYSYYVDYYDQQMKIGNFSKFVIDSKWNKELNENILKGLLLIGAKENANYFTNMLNKVNSLGEETIKKLVSSDGLNVNEIRDYLDSDLEFFMLEENLDEYNSNWLKSHPDLEPLPFNKIYLEIEKFLGYKFTNY